jgi:pseudouridine-5'-phosphate glycosidase
MVQGVTVAAYGTDEFPAFFTCHSGCRAPVRIDTPEQAAAVVHAGLRLNLGSGMVIGMHIVMATSFCAWVDVMYATTRTGFESRLLMPDPAPCNCRRTHSRAARGSRRESGARNTAGIARCGQAQPGGQ